jgi:hypothetical protein
MAFGAHPLEDDYPVITTPGQLAEFTTPCHWIATNICSAPVCVERAYPEACELFDLLVARLEEAAA